MRTELINPFVVATTHCLQTMSQTVPQAGEPSLQYDRKAAGAVTGIIGMGSAEYKGCMIVSFDETSILAIVSRMLMENFTQLNDEVVDAVGELTNMIVGNAKREFEKQGIIFDMASPVVLTGSGVALHQLGGAPTIVIPFKTPEGVFTVEANLAPVK